jgi:hypothetical protein
MRSKRSSRRTSQWHTSQWRHQVSLSLEETKAMSGGKLFPVIDSLLNSWCWSSRLIQPSRFARFLSFVGSLWRWCCFEPESRTHWVDGIMRRSDSNREFCNQCQILSANHLSCWGNSMKFDLNSSILLNILSVGSRQQQWWSKSAVECMHICDSEQYPWSFGLDGLAFITLIHWMVVKNSLAMTHGGHIKDSEKSIWIRFSQWTQNRKNIWSFKWKSSCGFCGVRFIFFRIGCKNSPERGFFLRSGSGIVPGVVSPDENPCN